MNTLKIDNNEFKVRDMNMIEMMALRSQINYDSFESTVKFYNLILENMLVLINDKWIPVKEKDKNIYYPAGIENSDKIEKLFNYFLEYVKTVFQKSNASKKEQE